MNRQFISTFPLPLLKGFAKNSGGMRIPTLLTASTPYYCPYDPWQEAL